MGHTLPQNMGEDPKAAEHSIAVQEFASGWKEFFGSKQYPKDFEEYKKQQDAFWQWYNNVRKQSDTGKTPSEMYKEKYGKGFPSEIDIANDEDGSLGELSDEDIAAMREDFHKDIWPRIKHETKDLPKRDACFESFVLGFELMRRIVDELVQRTTKELQNMGDEEELSK